MLKHLREYIDFDNYDVEETKGRLTNKEETRDHLTNKKFVEFLKNNDIYKKFLDNLRREMRVRNRATYYKRFWYSINTFCNDVQELDYINNAFFWKDTPEGHDFWERYHYEWQDICNLWSS